MTAHQHPVNTKYTYKTNILHRTIQF